MIRGSKKIIPGPLTASCRKDPARAEWLARLPNTLDHLERCWSLTLGIPFEEEATCSWVAPVTLADATSAVLKLGMPHMEGEHEIEGLRFWNGDPTVRLLDADRDLGAMLVERCEPGTPLRAWPEPEQDIVIARLLRRMWREPSPGCPFRPLSALMKHWSDETLAQAESWSDPGLVSDGLRLFAGVARDRGCKRRARDRSSCRERASRTEGAMAGDRPEAIHRRSGL